MAAKTPTELRKLQINRVSLVDAGANPGANIVLFKRDPKAITKSMSDDILTPIRKAMDGEMEQPATFDDALAEMEGRAKAWQVMDEIYPLTDAYRNSVCSIYEHAKGDERKTKLKESTTQFLSEMKTRLSEIAKSKNKEGDMDAAEIKKLLDPLTAQVTEANKAIATLKSALDTEKAANEELRKRLAGSPPPPDTTPVTKADLLKMDAATREIVEKAMSELAKSREEVAKLQADGILTFETQRIEKEFRTLPGDPKDYAKLVLKFEAGSEERKAVEKLLAEANQGGELMLTDHGTTIRKNQDGDPVAKLHAKAAEIRKASPRMTAAEALQQAYAESPELRAEIEEER